MPRQKVVWTLEAGTSKTFPLTLYKDDGETVHDLRLATTIRLLAKQRSEDIDFDAKTSKERGTGIEIVDPAVGTITVTFEPGDTARVHADVTYTWAVKVFYGRAAMEYGAYGELAISALGVHSTRP